MSSGYISPSGKIIPVDGQLWTAEAEHPEYKEYAWFVHDDWIAPGVYRIGGTPSQLTYAKKFVQELDPPAVVLDVHVTLPSEYGREHYVYRIGKLSVADIIIFDAYDTNTIIWRDPPPGWSPYGSRKIYKRMMKIKRGTRRPEVRVRGHPRRMK